jgi:23S rRNA (uridine2552-2'-O)-methyltransferase
VEFIQGDFLEDSVLDELESRLEGRAVDLVLSDMAPNMSGIELTDQARSIHLAELALEFAISHLRARRQFLVKVFQGPGFMEFRQEVQKHFKSLLVRKPKASRDRSPEVYLLGSGFRNAGGVRNFIPYSTILIKT